MCFKAVGREEGGGESQRLELCTAIASLYGSHSTDGHSAHRAMSRSVTGSSPDALYYA